MSIKQTSRGKLKMKKGLFRLKRVSYIVVALAATFMVSVPALTQVADAAQVTSRSIQMSSSAPGATSVKYDVTFTPQTTIAAGGGIVVDICSDSPIIGSTTCAYPTGFGWGTTTPSLTVNSGMGSGWTAAGVAGGGSSSLTQTLELTSSTGTLTGGGATPASFTISSVTNPTATNTPFYARILTFDTHSDMTTYYTISGTTRASSFTGMQDYGGAALSTSTTIAITATVMETLTFCTSALAPGPGCGTTGQVVTTPNLTLGSGTPATLSSTLVSTVPAYTQVSTNAQHGVVEDMTGTILTSGSNNIPAVNGGNATTPAAIVAGTAAFGMYCTAGSGMTASNPYAGGTTAYGLDTTGTGIGSTYGSEVVSSTTPLNSINSTFTFGATAASTTPAGVYTANMQVIATGTF